MDAEKFVWWLHGFFEVAKPEALTAAQVVEIKNHLELVKTAPQPTPYVPSTPFPAPPFDDYPPLPWPNPYDKYPLDGGPYIRD